MTSKKSTYKTCLEVEDTSKYNLIISILIYAYKRQKINQQIKKNNL